MKKIYVIEEAQDQEGRLPYRVKGYVKADNEDSARKKANDNGIHVEKNGFFHVKELSKEESKRILKDFKYRIIELRIKEHAFTVDLDIDFTQKEYNIGEKIKRKLLKIVKKELKSAKKAYKLIK